MWLWAQCFENTISSFLANIVDRIDGAHSIGVQNVTSNCNVAMLISFFFALYFAIDVLLLERFSFAGKIYENRFLALNINTGQNQYF